MNNSFVTRTRITLIQLGKVIPFVICFVVLVSYCENVYALLSNNYIEFMDGVYLNKPISWFIGEYFTINYPVLFLVVVLSFSIETCIYNKLACCYLFVNLYEKSFFVYHEYCNEVYCVVSITNIIVCVYLCAKGIETLTKK